MKTKLNIEHGNNIIELYAENTLDAAIINNINLYDAKITATKPDNVKSDIYPMYLQIKIEEKKK